VQCSAVQCSAGQSIIKSSENKALPGKGMGQLFKNQMSIEEGGSNGLPVTCAGVPAEREQGRGSPPASGSSAG